MFKKKTSCNVNSSVDHTRNFQHGDHAESVLKRMRAILDDNQLCDVVLVADDGTRIPAHRLVLSASTEYFASMFTGSLREAKMAEVPLKEISGEVLQLLVNFCYTGCIDLHEDTVEKVLASATLLQLNAVAEDCFQYLTSKLDPSNCLGIAFIADQYSNDQLTNDAKAYVCKHFCDVCNNEEFLQLDVEQLSQLLASDELNVRSEEDIFQALMRWIKYDQDAREKHMPRLLALVRLHLMSPTFIEDHVEPVCVTTDCQRMIVHAFKCHSMPERRAKMPKERVSSKVETLLGIYGGNVFSINCYLPHHNKWKSLGCIPAIDGIFQFGFAIFDNKLIIAGGGNSYNGSALNSVHSVSLDTLVCSNFMAMQSSRADHGLAVLKGSLYAIGGKNSNTVERYNSLTQCWDFVASIAVGRAGAGIAVLNDRLYVIGGYNVNTTHSSVECYDPETNQWTFVAPMSESRKWPGAAAVNGYLYAVGGTRDRFSLASAERYDPIADNWTLISSLPNPSCRMSCSSLENRLLVANRKSKFLYEYDFKLDMWQTLAPLQYKSQDCIVNASFNNDILHKLLSMENKD